LLDYVKNSASSSY